MSEKIIEKLKEKYSIRLAGATLISAGAILAAEHAYVWGWDSTFGHEWLGLILIFAGAGTAYLSKYGR